MTIHITDGIVQSARAIKRKGGEWLMTDIKNLLKTKFYPVSISKRTIINDPKKRDRDVFQKYRGKFIGIKGSRLNAHECYSKYKIVESI